MNKKLSYIEGWLSVALNIFLFGLKYYTGLVTGSIAVIADAWHTLSDSLTSVVVVMGAKVSSKASDEKHPFGHGRFELVASIIIGVLLAVAGGNFILESIEKLRSHQTYAFKSILIYVFTLSVIVKEAIARFSFWAAMKTGSRALRSDGWHHRSDALASLLVLAGMIIGRYIWWIDGVLGIIVGVLIIGTGIKIIKDDTDSLLGESPSGDLIDQIRAVAAQTAGPEHSCHHYHIHNYGNHSELTFHIKLNGNMRIRDGHAIVDQIEKTIYGKMGIETTIHMESGN